MWFSMHGPLWSEFDRIQRSLDELAAHMSRRTRFPFEPWFRTARIFPAVNITKDDSAYVVTAEIPSMNPEDLEVKVEGDTLTIKGERKPEQLGKGVSYHRKERLSGTFHRSLTLPGRVDQDAVKANYADGILTIVLPMEASARPKHITITSG